MESRNKSEGYYSGKRQGRYYREGFNHRPCSKYVNFSVACRIRKLMLPV